MKSTDKENYAEPKNVQFIYKDCNLNQFIFRVCRFNLFCDSLIMLRFLYSFCLDGVAEMEINKSLEMLKWSFALIQGIVIVEKESCIVVAPLKMAECF